MNKNTTTLGGSNLIDLEFKVEKKEKKKSGVKIHSLV